MRGRLRVGTSGWHYPHWRGAFYPGGMPSAEYLGFYAGHFDTVELNNSFYRLPSREQFAAWAAAVPSDFVFTVKASRYLTHRKKLKDPQEPLSRLLGAASGLGQKLGPVLFQLPPRWRANPKRLADFVGALPQGRRFVFEFRDPTWFTQEVYAILREAGCALCVASSPDFPEKREITADFLFLRFHGGRELYGSNYSDEELRAYARWAQPALDSGKDVYAYFNNDAYGYALANARGFREMLSS